MQELNKEEFIATTAARILAQMYNDKGNIPNPKNAVEMAYRLWEELVAQRGLVE